MKGISLRLDEDLLQKIDDHRGTKSKSDYIRDTFVLHFEELEFQSNTKKYQKIQDDLNVFQTENEKLKNDIQQMNSLKYVNEERMKEYKDQIESYKQQVKTLEQQLGFLQLEYQKLTDRLMLPAAKSWWQFWKK
jgi:peptidoglycan hydrolase CwlO-like protein